MDWEDVTEILILKRVISNPREILSWTIPEIENAYFARERGPYETPRGAQEVNERRMVELKAMSDFDRILHKRALFRKRHR